MNTVSLPFVYVLRAYIWGSCEPWTNCIEIAGEMPRVSRRRQPRSRANARRGSRFVRKALPRGRNVRKNTFNNMRPVRYESAETEKKATQRFNGVITLPKNLIAPQSIIVTLSLCVVDGFTRNSTMSMSWRYIMNTVFEPDPTMSRLIPGFSQWTEFYSRFRVLKFSADAEFINLSDSSVIIALCPSTSDLGPNYAGLDDFFMNNKSVTSVLSTKGGMDKTRLHTEIDLGQYWGDMDAYLADDSFEGTDTSDPIANLTMNYALRTSALMSSSATVYVRSVFSWKVLFYGVKTITTYSELNNVNADYIDMNSRDLNVIIRDTTNDSNPQLNEGVNTE